MSSTDPDLVDPGFGASTRPAGPPHPPSNKPNSIDSTSLSHIASGSLLQRLDDLFKDVKDPQKGLSLVSDAIKDLKGLEKQIQSELGKV